MTSKPTFSVRVEVEPATSVTRICLGGDIDTLAEVALDEVMRNLALGERRVVYVDIAGVHFAGTTLINFLVRASTVIGPDPPIVLFGVSASARRLLEMVGLGSLIDQHQVIARAQLSRRGVPVEFDAVTTKRKRPVIAAQGPGRSGCHSNR